MLSPNYLSFYNYYVAQNVVLQSGTFVKYKPQLYIAFFVKADQKKKVMQTCELFSQFFKARPHVSAKYNVHGKVTGFLIQLNLNKHSAKRFFELLALIRSGTRKKLISFQSGNRGSQIIIKLKDFVTLYDFKIKFYDFHDWRYTLAVFDNRFSGSVKDSSIITNNYCLNNFYYSFFKNFFLW